MLAGPAFGTSEHTEPLLSELGGGAEVARRGGWSPGSLVELHWGMLRRTWRETSRAEENQRSGWEGERAWQRWCAWSSAGGLGLWSFSLPFWWITEAMEHL